MNEPWTSYRFDYLERARINEIEDWIIDNPDEVAVRIVYLESLIGVDEVMEDVD